MTDDKQIVIISEGTGHTAKRLLDAVLVQYLHQGAKFSVSKIHAQARNQKVVDKILKSIPQQCLVIYSIIQTDLGQYLRAELTRRNIFYLDILQPMVSSLSKYLGVHADFKPGLLQTVDGHYYARVDSIGYTVEHDDGQGQEIAKADAVLIGPSRTCKTPISMHLACDHGLRVANIPIINDRSMTATLLACLASVKRNKIFGLQMHSEVLARVREARMDVLVNRDGELAQLQAYFDLREVSEELRHCRDLYRTEGFRPIEVTGRAIEEIALEIIEQLG